MGYTHRQENRRLVGHFYDMKIDFGLLAVGWAVGKKVWADYQQLLREVFSCFGEQKNFKFFFLNIVVSKK